jgi:hypothetical protein
MLPTTDAISVATKEPELEGDFAGRLEASLSSADRDRRRRNVLRRLQAALPIVLLVGPIIAWRLLLATSGSAQVGISALAWLVFVLDVGVHLDSALLSYLNLEALPSLVGGLLFILVTAWLLIDLKRTD